MNSTRQLLADTIRQQRKALTIAIVCAAVAIFSSIILLAASGWLLTAAGMAAAAGALALHGFDIRIPSLIIRWTVFTRTIGHYLERYFGHKAALDALAGLRTGVFRRLAALDPRTARPLSAAEGVARLTGDIDALEEKIIRMPATPAALAAAIFAVVATLSLGILTSAGLAGLFLLLPILTQRLAHVFVDTPLARAQALLGRYKAEAAAQAAAANEISVHGRVERATDKLLLTADTLDRARTRAAAGETIISGVLTLAAPVAALWVIATGKGSAALVALGTFAAIASIEGIAAYARGQMQEARISTGIGRLTELEQQDEPRTGRATGHALTIGGVTIPPGEAVALTGETGSGKTRILESFVGLRTDAPQRLTLGGAPVERIPFDTLAQTCALVPQAPNLIDATVAENLRMGAPEAGDAELWDVLRIACLADEVRGMAGDLQHRIGEAGKRLSGGQKKRLALARALLADRPVLLMDEPTEGLDRETEARLIANLAAEQKKGKRTILFTTHRPAALALADRVVPIDTLRTEKAPPAGK